MNRGQVLADELRGHGDEEAAGGIEGFVKASGEKAGLEVRHAEHGLLGEGDALDGEQFLGIDGLVDGDEVGAEVGDFLELFEADDSEGGGGEAVLAGIPGGAGLALRGGGAGGMGSVGAIGGELFFGERFLGVWQAVVL